VWLRRLSGHILLDSPLEGDGRIILKSTASEPLDPCYSMGLRVAALATNAPVQPGDDIVLG
jgi:hypothetical protein